MLTVDEALAEVLQRAVPPAAVKVDLDQALGLRLAADVMSDIDSPPHDKSMVDGYAVVAEDLASGTAELEILDEVVAGDVPRRPIGRGQSMRVMTGAPIPTGAEGVVMVERTRVIEHAGSPLGRVRIEASPIAPGQNIMRLGTSIRRGDVVLEAGTLIRPIEIGMMAEVGCASPSVIPAPSVAVLSTGNELVCADEFPGPGQIRNSNGPMLETCVLRAGGVSIPLGIGRDVREDLAQRIAEGLRANVLILSGGVSAGVLDLVPGVLAELGVRQVFHKVRLKPGKPLWFGTRAESGQKPPSLVFGLPGNPVSSLVCFELFVRPALSKLAGAEKPIEPSSQAALSSEFVHRGDRPTYHPARLETTPNANRVSLLRWHGSADLRTLAAANALAYFPAGDRTFQAGEIVEVRKLWGAE